MNEKQLKQKCVKAHNLYLKCYYQEAIDLVETIQEEVSALIIPKGATYVDNLYYDLLELKSYCYLCLGELVKGWELWIYRRSMRAKVHYMSTQCTLPYWSGKQINGELVIMAEEGLGDEIYNSKLFHLLIPKAKKVYIECDKRLLGLFSRTYPEITFFERDKWNEFKKIAKNCSCYGLVSDLQRFLDPFNDEQEERKLKIDIFYEFDDSIRKADKLEQNKGYSIGFSYFTYNKDQQYRNFSLKQLKEIKEQNSNALCLDLQKSSRCLNDVTGDGSDSIFFCVTNIDTFNDMEGLAALIHNYTDKIISIGNATAHLAARLGKKTTVYIPKFDNTRWIMQRDLKNKYYSTVTMEELR